MKKFMILFLLCTSIAIQAQEEKEKKQDMKITLNLENGQVKTEKFDFKNWNKTKVELILKDNKILKELTLVSDQADKPLPFDKLKDKVKTKVGALEITCSKDYKPDEDKDETVTIIIIEIVETADVKVKALGIVGMDLWLIGGATNFIVKDESKTESKKETKEQKKVNANAQALLKCDLVLSGDAETYFTPELKMPDVLEKGLFSDTSGILSSGVK